MGRCLECCTSVFVDYKKYVCIEQEILSFKSNDRLGDKTMDETKLKKLLKQRGLKQEWLAKEARIGATALSRIVQGKASPSLRNALRIAKALGVSVEDIWKED